MDAYDYVMHGRIFKIGHLGNQRVEVLASFGGLLFKLVTDQGQFPALQLDLRYTSTCLEKSSVFTNILTFAEYSF